MTKDEWLKQEAKRLAIVFDDMIYDIVEENMINKVIESLKTVFKGDKIQANRWLATKGFNTWSQVEKADAETLHELLKDLDEMKGREWITWQDGAYTYSRPKDIKNVSELRWKIRGMKI